jgi:hypothetical protein
MNGLRPDEFLLQGQWRRTAKGLEQDETCQRIESLLKSELHKVRSDPSGWDVLYRDPRDNRLWELTYPDSEAHGGGPPQLRHVTETSAQAKYGALVSK